MMVVFATSLRVCAQTVNPPVPAGRISGTVVHSVTGQPLTGIDVAISPTEQHDLRTEVTTGSDGRFVFKWPEENSASAHKGEDFPSRRTSNTQPIHRHRRWSRPAIREAGVSVDS